MVTAAERDRLIKLFGMTGSCHLGERGAAAAAAHRLVCETGLTWDAVIVPPPWELPPEPSPDPAIARAEAVARARRRSWTNSLNDTEVDFILIYATFDQATEAQDRLHNKIQQKIRAAQR